MFSPIIQNKVKPAFHTSILPEWSNPALVTEHHWNLHRPLFLLRGRRVVMVRAAFHSIISGWNCCSLSFWTTFSATSTYALETTESGAANTMGCPLSQASLTSTSSGISPKKSNPISVAVLRVPSLPNMYEGSPQWGHLKQLMFSTIPKICKNSWTSCMNGHQR